MPPSGRWGRNRSIRSAWRSASRRRCAKSRDGNRACAIWGVVSTPWSASQSSRVRSRSVSRYCTRSSASPCARVPRPVLTAVSPHTPPWMSRPGAAGPGAAGPGTAGQEPSAGMGRGGKRQVGAGVQAPSGTPAGGVCRDTARAGGPGLTCPVRWSGVGVGVGVKTDLHTAPHLDPGAHTYPRARTRRSRDRAASSRPDRSLPVRDRPVGSPPDMTAAGAGSCCGSASTQIGRSWRPAGSVGRPAAGARPQRRSTHTWGREVSSPAGRGSRRPASSPWASRWAWSRSVHPVKGRAGRLRFGVRGWRVAEIGQQVGDRD